MFKNNAPFGSYLSKIKSTFTDNAEAFDIVMSMYHLLEYSDNYSITWGSLWNYYRYEVNNDENEIDNTINRINNNKTITIKPFEYRQ